MSKENEELLNQIVQRYYDYMDWLGNYPSDIAYEIKGILFKNRIAYIAPVLHYVQYREYIENYSLYVKNHNEDNIKDAIIGISLEDVIHSIRVLLDRSTIFFSLWYKYDDFTDYKNGFGSYNQERKSGKGLVCYAFKKINDEDYVRNNPHDSDFLRYITWEYEDCFRNLSRFDNNTKHNQSHSVEISFEELNKLKKLPKNFYEYPFHFISYNSQGKITGTIESADLEDVIEHIYIYVDSILTEMFC